MPLDGIGKASSRCCASLPIGGPGVSALTDPGYRDKRLAKAGQALGITVEAVARGRDGLFIPTSFAGWWSAPYPG
jgi:hypothetical protein